MNDNERDPLLQALDDLAHSADHDHVGDRMPVITRGVRVQRIRRGIAVGAVTLVAATVAAAGASQLIPTLRTEPPPILGSATPATPTPGVRTASSEPTSSTKASPSPTADVPSGTQSSSSSKPTTGLQIEMDPQQIADNMIGLEFRIHGSHYGQADTEMSGHPPVVSVLLDGKHVDTVGYSEPSKLVCTDGAKKVTLDATFDGQFAKGEYVTVPGPGTYTITIQAPYCDKAGKVVDNEVEQKVTVGTPELSATDETTVDFGGDGTKEDVRLLMPKDRRVQGQSRYQVAEITSANGDRVEVPLYGEWPTTVVDAVDLNDDGADELIVKSSGADGEWWSVLTEVEGQFLALPTGGMGEAENDPPASGVRADGGYTKTFLRDGKLLTWHTDGAWDRESATEVTLTPWLYTEGSIGPYGEESTVCVTADHQTWEDPQPC